MQSSFSRADGALGNAASASEVCVLRYVRGRRTVVKPDSLVQTGEKAVKEVHHLIQTITAHARL